MCNGNTLDELLLHHLILCEGSKSCFDRNIVKLKVKLGIEWSNEVILRDYRLAVERLFC